jgi:hypothetical protein
MNLFFYSLQKDSKEKLHLSFNIIGNDVGRWCTRSHLVRLRMQTALFCLFIRMCLPVLRIVALHLLYGLHCLLILFLPEFYFLNSGVQLLGQGSSKGYLLLELKIPLILYELHMDVRRSACPLREMSILHSV